MAFVKRHVYDGGVLGNLVAAFDQPRNQQLPRIAITQDGAGAGCRRDDRYAVAALLVGYRRRLPHLILRVLRHFGSGAILRRARIIDGAAPGHAVCVAAAETTAAAPADHIAY